RSVAGVLTRPTSAEVKKQALDALRLNLNGSWSELRHDATFKAALMQALGDSTLASDGLALIGETGLTDFTPTVISVLANPRFTPAVQVAAIGVTATLGL